VAEGRTRVVLDPTEARLIPGEILVAPVTDVAWTPLFLRAGGLVVEVGGPLSHGSIVAREYGIPAVTAVAGATERIRSGDLVRVDGDRGVVSIVTRA
jgi:pyruvate,water dikinase